MIRVNANLFRIAMTCASTEETRYYLNGVHVEPHAVKGVVLVAVDGHRMVIIHDEEGECTASAILRLSKDALKACKPAKRDHKREVVFDVDRTGRADVVLYHSREHMGDGEYERVALTEKAAIDGTFPDWRRVLPSGDPCGQPEATAFNGKYLGDFGKMGADLRDAFDVDVDVIPGAGAMCVSSHDAGSPAIVRWWGVEQAFGILMPMSGAGTGFPAWLNAQPENPHDR